MRDDDMTLVREYVTRQSEPAFETLVSRYIDLVYSVALRQTCNEHLAEEITQAVFIILARKAGSLSPQTILPAWLHRTACFVANDALKAQFRRTRREQEAYMQSVLNESSTRAAEAWSQISPLLETAIAGLNEKDRQAVILRFLDNRSFLEVAKAIGVNEDAARMRVNRALEKLRAFFAKRGTVLASAIIIEALSANSLQAAPPALAKSVTAIAITKGATASTSTLSLIKGALKVMAWTKAKTALVIGASALLTITTTTVAFKAVQDHQTQPWQQLTAAGQPLEAMDKTPAQVKIVHSKFTAPDARKWLADDRYSPDQWRLIGTHATVEEIVRAAYCDPTTHIDNSHSFLVIGPASKTEGYYDYIANLKRGSREALQVLARQKFGLIGRYETKDMDVLLLQVDHPGASGLKPIEPFAAGEKQEPSRISDGLLHYRNKSLLSLAKNLESHLQIPVLDRTGLTARYDFDFPYKLGPDPDSRLQDIRTYLLTNFGLKLVPARQPHEVFVIEKLK